MVGILLLRLCGFLVALAAIDILSVAVDRCLSTASVDDIERFSERGFRLGSWFGLRSSSTSDSIPLPS